MISRILLASFLCFSCLMSGYASDLTALLQATKSMKAEFVQTILDNNGVAVQKSYGTMALQRPGKFRWQVTKPIPQLIIAKDGKLLIYDPDLEQLTVRQLSQETGEAPALFLSRDDAQVENDFIVKEQHERQGNWRWFQLIPKKSDSMFKSIELGFDNKQLEQIKLADNLGHTTNIEYHKIQTNISIPPTTFEFKPPKNVDVIDETK